MAGTFQGNLQGTPSRPLEYLTSSKAVTASYALESRKLGTADVGGPSQSMYLSGGLPVAISSTIGSKTKPVYVSGGKFTPGDDIPTSKTGSWDSVANWVTLNSGSITGLTGSTTESIANVGGLLAASGSWNSASQWVGSNSASISASVNKVNNLKGITFQTGAFSSSKSYHPTSSSNVTVNVPSTAAHVGAVSTASFNSYTASAAAALENYLPITGGTLTGDLAVQGDLIVSGTTVSIDAQNLNVKDKLILVASGSTTRAAANGAGIAVPTASAGEGGAARIQYESAGNRFTSSVNFAAPGFTGSLLGTASNATTASYALKATSASWAAEANHAVSASEALHAGNATSASYASSSTSASYANKSTTASYALVAESVKDGAGLVVNTASYAINAGTASHVTWANVGGKPNYYTASFVTGAFVSSAFNPTGSNVQIKIPSTTTHISGLNAITASVKEMVPNTASWNGMANTASAAYVSASAALATASQTVVEAQSASYWKTEASKSAHSAALHANTASGSMEDARFYSSQAATNATLASTYAVQSSASAQLAKASASAAQNSANAAASSASKAANWATSSSASANQAAYYAVSASASNTTIQQLAANVKQYYDNTTASAAQAATSATNAGNSATTATSAATRAGASASAASQSAHQASASAALLYKASGSATQPIYLTTDGPKLANAYSSLFTNLVETKNVLTASIGGTTKYATIHTASYALIAESVKDGAGLVVNTASYALDAAIKYGGHYTPSASGATAQGSTAARTYLKTINTDGKGHVVGFTTGSEANDGVTSITITTSSNYVTVDNAAAVTSTGTRKIDLSAATKGKVESGSAAHTWITANSGNIGSHTGSYLPIAGGTLTGALTGTSGTFDTVTVQKNLYVNGTASYVNTTDLIVKDKLILVSSGSTTRALANGAGIAVQTGSATTVAAAEAAAARFYYDGTNNVWSGSVPIQAASFTGSLLGTASRAVSASRADSAASATTSTTASYNKAGADALAWVTANSSSALTKYHPLSGTVTTPLLASNVTVGDYTKKYDLAFRQLGNTSSIAFGIGSGGINRGIWQYAMTGSPNIPSTGSGWILSWGSNMTASFGLGFRVAAVGFIGHLQGNVVGTASWASNAVSATTASMLQSNGITNPNSASVSHSAVKWFASLAQASGYAGTNYGFPTTNNANGILWLGTHPGYYGHQLGFSSTGRIYDRYISAGSFPTTANGGSWKTILNSDDTASWASATAIVNASASIWSAKGSGNGTVTSVTVTTSSNYVTVDSASAITTTGTRKIDLATKSKNAIDWVIANSGSAATAITNNHTHTNKAVLDGITAAKTASWDTAYGWGNHASAGYVKSSGVTSVTLTTASNYVSVDSAAAITTTGTRKIDLTAATKGKIESGSVAFGWGNHASAGYVKSSGVTSYTLTTSSDYVAVDNAAAVTSTGTRKIDLATKSKNAINWVIANSGSAATAITNNHTHSNKALLDSLTNAKTGSWDGKWTYNENTIKAVKVNSASRADSAASATTATKLAGTSGSATTPVWINGGVPTACSGTVITDAERKSWVTASNRAQAANDGLTTPLYHSQGEQETVVFRGAFMVVDASGGNITIDLADDEVPSSPNQSVDNYGAGVGVKLSTWGGLILNVVGTVEFVSETGASFVWSENSVDVEAGGTYEFNCIQYENGGDIYGIITKYSES